MAGKSPLPTHPPLSGIAGCAVPCNAKLSTDDIIMLSGSLNICKLSSRRPYLAKRYKYLIQVYIKTQEIKAPMLDISVHLIPPDVVQGVRVFA